MVTIKSSMYSRERSAKEEDEKVMVEGDIRHDVDQQKD